MLCILLLRISSDIICSSRIPHTYIFVICEGFFRPLNRLRPSSRPLIQKLCSTSNTSLAISILKKTTMPVVEIIEIYLRCWVRGCCCLWGNRERVKCSWKTTNLFDGFITKDVPIHHPIKIKTQNSMILIRK
ncbi:unnamed protein product [Lactuca virosa]|uniref:Uncharacterized protein n=1 Tax=Lactuca virosa TaxID=75947 RepID=A0AAU9NES8_9ASTR|nr:unnamed protein product [Lactuca virosa]